jgi:transcriptional regulator with XRE-family HTH domain
MRNLEDRLNGLRSAIGERIKSICKERGFSLEELARRTGFAKSYLSQIENLRREPSISS